MEEKGKDSGMVLKLPTMRGIVVLLVSMTFVLVLLVTPAAAQPVKVWVNAPEYVEEGASFVATIDVDNIRDFNMGIFDLSFNSSVVVVTDVEDGRLNEVTIPVEMWAFMDENTIRVLLAIPGVSVVSGSGYLAKISFEAVGKEGDESELNLSNGELVCFNFTDSRTTPEEIPAEWTDVKIRIVKEEPEPTPTPPVNRIHNLNTGESFSSIQHAIDDPDTKDGHVIEVEDGVYYENVKVTKSLTIRSENGSANCIVHAEKGNDPVFEITANYACISGFTVKGALAWSKAGIYLNSSYCSVSDNNCSNNYCGISIENSTNNTVSDNNCFLNNEDGISLSDSSNNTLSDNNCSANNWAGICLHNSSNNTIFDNNLSNNLDGIRLRSSNNSILSDNRCSSNWEGISLRHSRSNTLSNNNCSSNNGYGFLLSESSDNNVISNNACSSNGNGVALSGSSNNIISDNNCSLNDIGIHLWLLSNNNAISNNTCFSNTNIGIRICASGNNCLTYNNCSSNIGYGIFLLDINNKIYLNNFINNTNNVHSVYPNNIWNSPQKINYIYNGSSYTNYMGNYWSDYEGLDEEGDGIGDAPYYIGWWDKDNYPLMQPRQNYFPEETKTNENKNPKLSFTSYYQPINISINLSVPPYSLPLNLSNISNIENINVKFRLTEREEELLRTNGFVIIDYGNEDDIVAPYEDLKERGIPIFVTTDTLLHLYHIQFNEILKGIEEREFFDELVDLSNAMLEHSTQDYENFTDPEMKEAARRNVAYFAVALKLLQTPTEGYNSSEDIKEVNFTIPDYVKEDVDKETENIEQHGGFHPSVIFNSNPNCICDYPCCYCEDYSQYVPRGHYTRSEKLKRYFNAMMWYGRMAFLLKGGDEALISEQDAKISTIQAALISSELPDVNVNNRTVDDIWNRIYTVTAFFVGTADDLTPYEYRDALNIVFGTAYNASDLSDENKLLELKVELARLRSPKIYGGSGVCVVYPPITEEKLYVCLNKTKGMRFMGQRFVPDSYMFDQLVSPAVGMYTGNGTPFTMCYTDLGRARCLPRGLDIMTVLGSERAEDILIEEGDTEYAGLNTSYEKQLSELKSEFAGFNTSNWNRNLYWSWRYTLKPLLTKFGDGYPTFMNTKAWQEKELQTALASWTELRHDTILYAKQSYTPPLKGMPPKPKPVVGYVEPVPEFYARLLALTEMTEKGLVDLDVLNETEKARLQNLEGILERLMDISKAELENEVLTEEDYEFIRDFGANLDSLVAGVTAKGKETTIVADVHTDCNTEMVLEEGVGYVDLILVAYIVPDGRIILGAGPVFSYYEFKHPMDDRLTDEKWKEMLRSNPPERPGWVDGIGVDG